MKILVSEKLFTNLDRILKITKVIRIRMRKIRHLNVQSKIKCKIFKKL